MTIPRPIAWLPLLALVGCATPGGEEGRFEDPEGRYRVQLSRPVGETFQGEDFFEFQVPGDGALPITCGVLDEATDLPGAAVRVTEAVFSLLEASGGELGERQTAAIGAGEIDGRPYQHLATALEVSSEQGRGVGLLKVSVANKQGFGLMCHLWGAEVAEGTFEQVFEELVTSFESHGEPEPEPYYEEIALVKVGDLEVGFVRQSALRDEEGDVRLHLESSLLLPTSPSELQVNWSESIEWARPDGRLINAFAYESDAEEQHTELALARDDGAVWRVSGTYIGKELEAELAHEGELASLLSEMLVLREHLAPRGERKALSLARWLPDANPVGIVTVDYDVIDAEQRRVRIDVEGMVMEATTTEEGYVDRATADLAGARLSFETILRRGGI